MARHTTPSIRVAAFYKDPRAAIEWLQTAFGFEIDMLIEDDTGELVHSQLRFGDGIVMVGPEWSANHQSPLSTGGRCTQTISVHMDEDIDAHFARAKAAGAVIDEAPSTQFYGDRTYRARDPEGHIWSFGQTVEEIAPAEWDKATGLRTWTRSDKDEAAQERP